MVNAIVSQRGDVIYTTESDSKTGRGKIGVRDRHTENSQNGIVTASFTTIA